MKKLLTLSMLISFAMVCSCQKQGSAAERQLAQRKAQLDARETALDERERALIERENATAKARTIPRAAPGQTPDPAQMQAERERRLQQLPAHWDADRDKRIQQLPPEVRTLIEMQEQLAEKKRRSSGTKGAMPATEQLNRMKTDAMSAAKESLGAEPTSPPSLPVYPQAEVTSPPQLAPLSVYPQPEATSPTPSPTPQ